VFDGGLEVVEKGLYATVFHGATGLDGKELKPAHMHGGKERGIARLKTLECFAPRQGWIGVRHEDRNKTMTIPLGC
jgi:hypothetical protein